MYKKKSSKYKKLWFIMSDSLHVGLVFKVLLLKGLA